MDWNKVQTLARTPRTPSPELLERVGNRSPLYAAGCAGIALGVLVLLASAVGVFFTRYALAGVGLALLVVLVGVGLVIASRRNARALAEQAASQLPLVLVGVVQGNDSLFRPEGGYAGAVLVFATDPSRGLDHEWLGRLLARLMEVKNQGSPDPRVAQLVQALWNPQSLPDEALPPALTEGVPAWIHATSVDASTLPGDRIPDHRMIPALLDGHEPILLPGSLWA